MILCANWAGVGDEVSEYWIGEHEVKHNRSDASDRGARVKSRIWSTSDDADAQPKQLLRLPSQQVEQLRLWRARKQLEQLRSSQPW